MIKRHAHNLTRTLTATMNMGLNYPTIPVEVFPGDSFKLSVRNLARFLPQISPTMHNVNINVETYQVPWRQLFDKIGLSWDDFLTGGEDGTTEIALPMVTTPEEGYEPGSLADFLGIPTNYIDPKTGTKVIQPSITVNGLPVIAYMHVINENYRDQNFIKKLDLTKYQEFLDGTYEFKNSFDEPLGYDLFRPGAPGLFPRAWSRDYFGRAMPNTQRGPVATLGIGDRASLIPSEAPVVPVPSNTYKVVAAIHVPAAGPSGTHRPDINIPSGTLITVGQLVRLRDYSWPVPYYLLLDQHTLEVGMIDYHTNKSQQTYVDVSAYIASASGEVADLSSIYADLSAATNVSIIQFRLAARMQAFGEKLQQAGARAVEYTMAFFGVRVPDDRIQRPIYHGAFRLPVYFSEVLQTSESSNTSPLGQLSGHGITAGENKALHIKCIEHGYLIQIISVMPRSQYHNILPRLYLRKNRFDIPNPVFSHVGEQAIDQIEIFPRTTEPTARFGYVPRYSELGHLLSTVHGHMKDTFAHWHMARIYPDAEPTLSAAFRYELPTNRSFAVQDEDQIQVTLGIRLLARRPFAKNPRPGIHIV